jgi:hypothetical protein
MKMRMRKRLPVRTDRWGTGIRWGVLEAIDRVWPNGVGDMSFDPDESYLSPLHPKLSRALVESGTRASSTSVMQTEGPCGG